MFNDRCCEQNKTCQCERALGGGAAANQMDRSIFLQRLTFQMEPDSKRSQPCRDWRGGHENNTVGTHGGTWSLLTWRKQVPSPLPPLPPAAWPGALPSPTSLYPARPLLVQLSPCHPRHSSQGWLRGGLPFYPCINSQCLANRWRSVNACGIVE